MAVESAINEEFSKRLRCLVERKGLTQKQFADSVGAGLSAVKAWLRGVNTPNTHHYQPICETLGTSLDYLFFGTAGLLENNQVRTERPTRRDGVASEALSEAQKAIYAKQAEHCEDIREIKTRIGILEAQYASLSNRIDRIDDRLARIETRLDATDG